MNRIFVLEKLESGESWKTTMTVAVSLTEARQNLESARKRVTGTFRLAEYRRTAIVVEGK